MPQGDRALLRHAARRWAAPLQTAPLPIAARHPARSGGFTLIEALVALTVTALALAAGARAVQALSGGAARQADVMLAQLCAENELVRVRLAPRMPAIGEAGFSCEQAGRTLSGRLVVQPTPNPSFVRVDARMADDAGPLLELSTVVGRY